MFDLIRARFRHGYQAVPDLRKAVIHTKFRGFPVIDSSSSDGLDNAAQTCPSNAINSAVKSIDLGKCVFCGECQRISSAVRFTNFHKTASSFREGLIVTPNVDQAEYEKKAIVIRKEIVSIFGRSLKLRSVSAGGCNACEMELNACGNVNFDMGRFGIEVVASPRHADGLVITGPVSENMSEALQNTFDAIPAPKIVIASGACAISGGIFASSPAVNRKFFDKVKPDLYIPGCPPHPLAIINGILTLMGKK